MSVSDKIPSDAAGHCACGGVTYRVTGPLRPVWNCHCDRCRRILGHFMAATECDAVDLVLDAESTLQWYVPREEPAVQYGFCNHCGGSLFWRSDTHPGAVSICAGTLDPPTNLTTEGALFVAEASDYHALDRTLIESPYDRG